MQDKKYKFEVINDKKGLRVKVIHVIDTYTEENELVRHDEGYQIYPYQRAKQIHTSMKGDLKVFQDGVTKEVVLKPFALKVMKAMKKIRLAQDVENKMKASKSQGKDYQKEVQREKDSLLHLENLEGLWSDVMDKMDEINEENEAKKDPAEPDIDVTKEVKAE